MKIRALHLLDFYKSGHREQYPEGTSTIYSNFTPRSGKHSNVDSGGVINFGLQGFIRWYLIDCWNETFFNIPKETVVKQYKRLMDNALGIDAVKVDHVEALHDLGYLPLKIKALPEGAFVPYGVPLFTIVNTNDNFEWLTNYLESIMSTELWKACTSATTAKVYRDAFLKHAEKTGMDPAGIPWMGHDFSFRGMSGVYDSVVSGAAHLLSFTGGDTVPAIDYLEDYYYANSDKELIGGSVPATEHSVACLGICDIVDAFEKTGSYKQYTKEDFPEFGDDFQGIAEAIVVERLIKETYPTGIVSLVSDSYDFWKVMTKVVPHHKDIIMAREGRVVIRPDSGIPEDIICGTLRDVRDYTEDCEDKETLLSWLSEGLIDNVRENTPHGEHGACENSEIIKWNGKYYEAKITNISWNRHDKQYYFVDMWDAPNTKITEIELTPEMKGAYELLWDTFGGTTNEKGYKELDTHVGLIYGDSITVSRQAEILSRLEAKGFTASNLVLGIGSYTYTYVTRDTHGFAMKATYGVVNGEGRSIYKDPKTDSGLKKSAKGLLRVDLVDAVYKLTDQVSPEEEEKGELSTVFLDGKLVKEQTLSEIRVRVKA